MNKKHSMVLSLTIVSVLLGSLLYHNFTFADRPSEPTSVDVVNLPLDEQGNLKVKLMDDEVWQVINELQTKVESLNASIVEFQERISKLEAKVGKLKSPQIITVNAYPNWMLLFSDVWTDLIAISDVTVPEGANVIAIGVATFQCTEEADSPLTLRYRANNSYNEERWQGSAEPYNAETIEIHHTWTNLTAGTYSFAMQYHVYHLRTIYVKLSRLTLIVFPSSIS